MNLAPVPEPTLFAPASRGRTGFSKRGAGGYGTHPCVICGVILSNNGAGTAAHLKAHVRRGQARTWFNEAGEAEYARILSPQSP